MEPVHRLETEDELQHMLDFATELEVDETTAFVTVS